MDTEDAITFCQGDLPSISFAVLEDMRKRAELCDLTIRVRNQSFVTHRVILAAAIPYFRSSVVLNSGAENIEKEINAGDLDPRALESLISFAYCSKVRISTENVQSLLWASQFLKLYQVRDACVEFLSKRLRVDNVIQVRTFANKLNNPKLREISDSFIRKNFSEISESEDFLSLSHSSIKEIISDDDLDVTDEQMVFDAVIHWVKSSPSERHTILPELLSEVRMVYIPTDYLIKRVASEELTKTSRACADLIDDVKSYHLLHKDRSMFPHLKIIPRKSYTQQGDVLCSVYQNDDCNRISAYFYDFDNERWHISSNKAQSDGHRVNSAVAVIDKIYIFLEETIHTVHVKTLEWEVLEPRHEDISEAAILFHENIIYCFGSKFGDSSRMRCFDTQRKEWLKEGRMPNGRRNSRAASLGETIYVTGGYDAKYSDLRVVEKYNTAKCEWSETASMLTERSLHGCTSIRGKIYVCGGFTIGGHVSSTAEVYDPLTNHWNFISPLKTPRHCFSLVSYADKIYALGGEDSYRRIQDLEVYDPENDQWKSGFSVPGHPDQFLVCCVMCQCP